MIAVRVRATLAAITLITAACTSATSGRGRQVAICAPVLFGVPGSGQGAQNPAPVDLPDGLTQADADRYGTTIGLLKTDLARLAGKQLASASPIDYPATPIRDYIGPTGLLADLDTSEAQGVATLVTAIHDSYRDGCTARPVLVGGYSQGAEVVIRAVSMLTAAQRAGVTVALFGNPSHEPNGLRPSFRHSAYELPADVRSRTIDLCAPGDPVCRVDPARTSRVGKVEFVLTHFRIHMRAYAFGTAGYVERAARFLWQHRR
jgi:Cutinase